MTHFNPFSLDPKQWRDLISTPASYPFPTDPSLETHCLLPVPIDRVWAFFSNPHNLKAITPPSHRVIIDPNAPQHTQTGMTFSLKARLGPLPLTWHVHYPMVWDETGSKGFIDIQVYTTPTPPVFPFKRWCHCHIFEDKGPQGTLVLDRIRWQSGLPYPLNTVANWETKRQLTTMMRKRYESLTVLFTKSP